jgi:hypothetical protein
VTDEDTLRGLATRISDRKHHVRRLDAYYDGELRLAALGLSLPPEMRALQTVVNWPRVTVDALRERVKLEGFRMRGAEDTDDRLWSWWQANNLDEESALGHLESFVQGLGYVSVGYDEDRPDTPIIICESARNMLADVDPRTRKVKTAVRLYDHDVSGEARSATLYVPGRNIYFTADRGRWVVTETVETGIDRVPVVPMVNRSRLHDRSGRSEMADVMGLTDAACRNLTNLQGAQELMALPTRYVFGISEADMKTQEGEPVTKWEAYLGRFNALGDPDAKVQQLPAADLTNFTRVLDSYAGLVSSVTGLPPHYLGLTTENPASADAIRSSEARHVKRAEDKCAVLGGVWEEVMRLAMLIVDGNVPEEAERMESVFADPATPTYAAKVDAVVKLAGAGLLPREAAWEELGYSPERRQRLASLAEADPTNRLIASLGIGGSTDTGIPAQGAPGATQGVSDALPNAPAPRP